MATHSSILSWRIPRTEEPGGLQSMGSQRRTRVKGISTHRALLMPFKAPLHFRVLVLSSA